MSRTKDVIMDIMDWYGYIPKGYTFTDYHKDVEKRKQKNQESNRDRQTTSDLHDKDQKERV